MKGISVKSFIISFLSAAFLAFGMYHIHSVAAITEGGVLGAVLLLQHWLCISPAVSSIIMNTACYILGFKTFGKSFLMYSFAAAVGYSLSYSVCELFPPLYPDIAQHPFIAAVLGSLFVGIGCGICVRIGGAPTGDDAFAMSISKQFHIPIQWVYLISDLTVLLLSLTYIPANRIVYSLITVILSGQIIGFIQKR